MMSVTFEPLDGADESHLWQMLRLASHEEDVDAVRANSSLARYVTGWGRTGDFGIITFSEETCIGAAWCRLWSGEDRGFGFVSVAIPELAVAVAPDWQGRGVGTQLLEAVLKQAAANYEAISRTRGQSGGAVV